jgi:hypothetical protein
MEGIETLPRVLLELCFLFLNKHDITQILRVCRTFRSAVTKQTWNQLFYNEYKRVQTFDAAVECTNIKDVKLLSAVRQCGFCRVTVVCFVNVKIVRKGALTGFSMTHPSNCWTIDCASSSEVRWFISEKLALKDPTADIFNFCTAGFLDSNHHTTCISCSRACGKCGAIMCVKCVYTICGTLRCGACVKKCVVCGRARCEHCSLTCECGVQCCSDCMDQCHDCGIVLCASHRCKTCSRLICAKCMINHGYPCDCGTVTCSVYLCDGCGKRHCYEEFCDKCFKMSCHDCVVNCEACGVSVCGACVGACSNCAQNNICKEHSQCGGCEELKLRPKRHGNKRKR